MLSKNRSKVQAEFNLSSLTDIIFLLLIFFMLTSKMVQINMPLPEKDVATYVRYSKNKENATISIIAETGVTYDKMHIIMKIASGLKLRAILAPQPHS